MPKRHRSPSPPKDAAPTPHSPHPDDTAVAATDLAPQAAAAAVKTTVASLLPEVLPVPPGALGAWGAVALESIKRQGAVAPETLEIRRHHLQRHKELAKALEVLKVQDEKRREAEKAAAARVAERVTRVVEKYWQRQCPKAFESIAAVEFKAVKAKESRKRQQDLLTNSEQLTAQLTQGFDELLQEDELLGLGSNSASTLPPAPTPPPATASGIAPGQSQTQNGQADTQRTEGGDEDQLAPLQLPTQLSEPTESQAVLETQGGSSVPAIDLRLKLLNTLGGERPLRPYQRTALAWLVNRYRRNLNGILADEMGLGKTVQTLALMAYFAEHRGDWGPHLVVVPTTVVMNWALECQRWVPGFKVITYIGSRDERQKLRQGWTADGAFNICITSYNILLSDRKVFHRRPWGLLVVDEAHHLKNWAGASWRGMFDLHCEYRLLLTGTPLQTSVMELWSLFHFIMPSATAFGSVEEFSEWFNTPLADMSADRAAADAPVVARLHAMLRPFLLRRLKNEVAKDLPSKREVVVRCKLSRRQRQMYDGYMQMVETRAALSSGGYTGVFSVLLALRKVCNHPDMFAERPVVSPLMLEDIVDVLVPGQVCLLDNDPADDEWASTFDVDEAAAGRRSGSFSSFSTTALLRAGFLSFTPQFRQAKAPGLVVVPNDDDDDLAILLTADETTAAPQLSAPQTNESADNDEEGTSSGRCVLERRAFKLPSWLRLTEQVCGAATAKAQDPSRGWHNAGDDSITMAPSALPSPLDASMAAHQHDVLSRMAPTPPPVFRRKARIEEISPDESEGRWASLRHRGSPVKAAEKVSPRPDVEDDLREERALEGQKRSAVRAAFRQHLGQCRDADDADDDAEVAEWVEFCPVLAQTAAASKESSNAAHTLRADRIIADSAAHADARLNAAGFAVPSLAMFHLQTAALSGTSPVTTVTTSSSEAAKDRHSKRRVGEGDATTATPMEMAAWKSLPVRGEVGPAGRHLFFTVGSRVESAHPILERFCVAVTKAQMEYRPRLTATTTLRRAEPFVAIQETMTVRANEMFPVCRLAPAFALQKRLSFLFPDPRLLVHDCGKFQILAPLLKSLKREGHRCCIFTQFTHMLTILERFLALYGVTYLRMDSSLKPEQRQQHVEQFNHDDRIFCMILSTRSGGIGLNLVGADTVIFIDSDWNPAMDLQAQDRCHRIGQSRDVTIYRLVTDRTVEQGILKKARQRKMLNNVVIRGGGFSDEAAKARHTTKDDLLRFFDDLDEDADRGEPTVFEEEPAAPPPQDDGAADDAPPTSAADDAEQKEMEEAMAAVEDDEDRAAAQAAQAEVNAAEAEEGGAGPAQTGSSRAVGTAGGSSASVVQATVGGGLAERLQQQRTALSVPEETTALSLPPQEDQEVARNQRVALNAAMDTGVERWCCMQLPHFAPTATAQARVKSAAHIGVALNPDGSVAAKDTDKAGDDKAKKEGGGKSRASKSTTKARKARRTEASNGTAAAQESDSDDSSSVESDYQCPAPPAFGGKGGKGKGGKGGKGRHVTDTEDDDSDGEESSSVDSDYQPPVLGGPGGPPPMKGGAPPMKGGAPPLTESRRSKRSRSPCSDSA